MHTDVLITARLRMQPLSIQEASFIYELVNTEGWLKYIGDRNVRSVNDAVEYVKNIVDNPAVNYWVVKDASKGKCLGVVTLIKKEYLRYRDIGFAFLPDFEGKGYAFESAQAMLNLLREKKPGETILACTLPENRKSIKLLERLGMGFSEKITVDGEELLLYSIK